MNTSEKGIKFIEDHEGIRLSSYLDSIGVPTIGCGHTGPEVQIGQTITKEQANALLREDLKEAEDAISRHVNVNITQDQYDALVSFIFNVGEGNFKASTMLRMINAQNFEGAAEQFTRWDMAGGRHIAGLANRRHEESALFQGEYFA